ncbi:MAG: flavin reductase, partial [Negativicoccus succinicivorans]|nr:flavin reductase [Negativicoccus succinicivorans]
MREISVTELQVTPQMIGNEWWLVTAGDEAKGYNTMTASWGHVGVIWQRPTAIVYIRPQRYTKEFMDRADRYTLSLFGGDYKKEMGYLGSHSGRDGDKVAKVGLTPVFEEDYTYFAEAEIVIVCRKLYQAPLLPAGFIDARIIAAHYPNSGFHEIYIGEIEKVLV